MISKLSCFLKLIWKENAPKWLYNLEVCDYLYFDNADDMYNSVMSNYTQLFAEP